MDIKSTIRSEYDLTEKQNDFVFKYIEFDCNGTKAAMDVYKCKTTNAAGVKAFELLRKPKILKAVKEVLKTHMAVHGLRKSHIINEMVCIAFSDIADYLEVGNGGEIVKDFKELGPKSKAVKRFKVSDTVAGQDIELNMYDKGKMLETLAKIQGLFDGDDGDDVNVNVNISLFKPKKEIEEKGKALDEKDN